MYSALLFNSTLYELVVPKVCIFIDACDTSVAMYIYFLVVLKNT